MAKTTKNAEKITVQDNESTETPVSGAETTPTKEENKDNSETTEEPRGDNPSKDPQEPSETPEESAKDTIDIKDLKEKKFITQVITPETLDKDNLSTYVTQVAKASELAEKLK